MPLTARDPTILVDFGLFQGANNTDKYNHPPIRSAFDRQDPVILTRFNIRADYPGLWETIEI
jgi:hypothetical protein